MFQSYSPYSSGYSYSSYASSASPEISPVFVVVLIILAIVVIIGWIVAIGLFVERAKEKDPDLKDAGILWVVGIFASPIVLGLYVISLPDKSRGGSGVSGSGPKLPSL